MSRRVIGSRAIARVALVSVVFVVASLLAGVSSASAQSAAVSHYCFKENGRFDVTLANPQNSTTRVFEVELSGLPVRTRTLQPGQVKSLSFTGRADGTYLTEVRVGGSTIERYVGTVACDPEVQVVVDCLAGNGRVAVSLSNRSSNSAIYRVSLTGLPSRTRIVASNNSSRFTFTGRPDRLYDLSITRDGREIFDEQRRVDCDPDPVFAPVTFAEDVTGVAVSCAVGLGRFDVNVVFEPDSGLPGAMYFEVLTGRIDARTAVLTQGSSFAEVITGRNNGEHTVTVRANGAVYFSEVVDVDC